MYIVAIGWIFVAAMAAIGAQSVLGGMMTFIGFILPLLLLLWIFGGPARARRRKAMEALEAASERDVTPDDRSR
jgi:hypothetical protein